MAFSTGPMTLEGISILVVEDNYEFRMFISGFLTRYGAMVYAAEHGKAGLNLFKRHRIDVVITDVTMPEMDGLAMVSEIRRFDQETPIVFLSVFTDDFYLFTDGFSRIKYSKSKPALAQLLQLLVTDRNALFGELQPWLQAHSSKSYQNEPTLKDVKEQLPKVQSYNTGLPIQRPQNTDFKHLMGTLSVLFVVHECSARDYLSHFLGQHVETLYTASNGSDALRIFETHQPRLVIAGITMTGMSGLELAEEIRARSPDVQIILISDVESWSYQESKLLTLLKLAGNKFLDKPLTNDSLLQAIQFCLDQYDTLCDMHVSASMFMTSGLAMSISDVLGNILAVNPAFTAITGYSMEEVKGRSMEAFSSVEHDGEFYRRIWDSVNDKGRWSGEICSRRKNGASFWEWVTVTGVQDWKGRISGYIAIFSVISQRSFAEEKLQNITQYDKIGNLALFSDPMHSGPPKA